MNELDRIPRLRVENLRRTHESGRILALDGVSLQARGGEMLALMGPSGCGKSTLLSLVGLLDRPDAGTVWIDDQDISKVRAAARFRAATVGFVFQFHHLLPTMTLLENVAAPLIGLGVGRADRRERARQMLEAVGIGHRAHALPHALSGGERQRGAVARALVTRPRVVLADEPTGNLDSVNGDIVIRLLREQADQSGSIVLMATHNPEVTQVADRTLRMRDGRLMPI